MGRFSNLQSYGLAVLSCGIALAVAQPLDAPVSCFLLAVMASSLYGGQGPGLVSLGLAALTFDYFFLPPQFHLAIETSAYLRFAAFLGAGLTAVVLIEMKRRAEQSRREIHSRYRIIADTAPDAIVSVDPNGRILFINPATTKMFAWTAPELIGEPFSVLMPKFQIGERRSCKECFGRRKDGTEFAVEISFGEVGTGGQAVLTGFIRDISERKESEAALKKSESFLAEAQRLSQTGSFGWNVATGELFWSDETFRMLRHDAAVAPSLENLFQQIHPEDRARVKEIVDQAARSGAPLDFEHRFLLEDGSEKHVHVRAHSVEDDSGVRHYLGAVMDISARVRADQDLRRAQAYLVEAEKLSHTGSWVWDVRLPGPIYWSAEMYRIHGLNPEDGLPSFEAYQRLRAPQDWAELMEAVDRSARERTGMDCECRLLLPDGTIKYTHIVGHPVTNDAGEVVQIVGTTIDVTEQHQARAALEKALAEVQQSESRLRRIINTIPTLAWSARPDGSVDYFNDRWLAYTGLGLELALNWAWSAAVHPEDQAALSDHWSFLLKSKQPGEVEARLRSRAGEYRWFLFRASPLFDESGNVVKWYGTNTDIEDRKRAEEALRASEHNFRLIADSIPGLVCTMTANGEVELANRQIVDYFGKTVAELKDWYALVHEDDRARVRAAWIHSVQTGDAYEIEHRLRGANGAYRWFHIRGLPLRNSDGHIVRWYNLLTDIEDRKHAEEALRASESNLRQIVDSIPGFVCTETPAAGVELVNQQFLNYTGKNFEEVQRWSTVGLIHQEDLPRVIDHWRYTTQTGQPHDIEYRVRSAGGVFRWFHVRGLPSRDSSGTIVRWYYLFTDIEDRKNAEQAVQASQRDLSLIIETMPALVWCAASGGELTYVNRRVLEYTGATLGALAETGWVNFLHPDDVEPTIRAWSHAVARGQQHEVQYRLRRSDGVYRWFHVVGQATRDREGQVARWYGLLIDIEDRKNAEDALRSTEARLARASQIATFGELAASIAHEVNQPLSAVVANGHACLRWLLAEPPNVAKARQAAERIVRDGKEAGEVVRRIRALFKRDPLEKVALDLNEVILEVLDLVRGEITRRRVVIETQLDDGLAPVVGDRVQLQQLILNLLLNGMDAMDSLQDCPKKLSIRSMRQDDGALFEIRDCGIGLPDPERVFEPFFTTKENGMGMGLAICRSIVDAHEGRVWAVSRQGFGTTFCVSLPLLATVAQ